MMAASSSPIGLDHLTVMEVTILKPRPSGRDTADNSSSNHA